MSLILTYERILSNKKNQQRQLFADVCSPLFMKLLQLCLLPLSLIFLVLNFTGYNINEPAGTPFIHEKFDASLTRLNTLDLLSAYADSAAASKHLTPGTLDYVIEMKNIVSYRFYHKYATQNLNENWLASVAQKITGLYLSSKIQSNDILTRPYGYCGQQNVVLKDLLEMHGIQGRVLYFPRHFVLQAFVEGNWCFFDADGEPDIKPYQRCSKAWLMNPDSLAIAYNKDTAWVAATFGKPIHYRIGRLDEIRGPRAQLFQDITKILSRTAFLFPLLLYVYLKLKQKRKAVIVSTDIQQAA